MKTIKHILLLGLISIALHAAEQMVLVKVFNFEFLQETQYLFIIATMLVYLVAVYFMLRRWNKHTRPAFFKTWVTMFVIQLFTIVSLSAINIVSLLLHPNADTAAMAMQPDVEDLMIKALLFACILPLVILAVLYPFDRKK